MMRLVKFLLPVFVLLAAVFVGWLILKAKPVVESRRPPPSVTRVEVIRAEPTDFQIVIESQGTVQPRTETTLTARVSGQVIRVAPGFRAGGFFEQGDVLLEIDPLDYETAVVVAEAALAQARLRLAEEEARSAQALRDWEKIGRGEPPSPLALREPQLAEAAAAARAAEARLVQARNNLEYTKVRAPFEGRILEHRVDIGQYVNSNTVLARIYSVDFAEVRLPLSERQLDHVELPERYRGESADDSRGPEVEISGGLGTEQYTWTGHIVRTEGAVDQRSRQLFIIAQVPDPYGRTDYDRPPLKVGMFVRARINGRTLENVFVLPRAALRENRLLLIARPEDQLERREIDVVWRDSEVIVVRDSLKPGERVIVTQLAYAVDGMKVTAGDGRGKGPGAGREVSVRTGPKPEGGRP
jgi:RND family efflux transporter MFP subunit